MKTTSGGGFEMRALLASRYRHTYAQSVFDRSASFWRMASKVGFERICARSILVPGSISARRRSLSAASAASFGGEQTVAGWFLTPQVVQLLRMTRRLRRRSLPKQLPARSAFVW